MIMLSGMALHAADIHRATSEGAGRKGQLKKRCGLEPRTNFFRLRNRQKLVRNRFGCGLDSRIYGIYIIIYLSAVPECWRNLHRSKVSIYSSQWKKEICLSIGKPKYFFNARPTLIQEPLSIFSKCYKSILYKGWNSSLHIFGGWYKNSWWSRLVVQNYVRVN